MRKRAVRAEKNLHAKVAENRRQILTDMFRTVTTFGSLTFGSILAAALYSSGKKDTSKSLFTGLVSSRIATFIIKNEVGRIRPENSLVTTRTPSFPSGHTAAAFSVATVLNRRTDVSGNFLYGLASLVGLSRIYLGAHYLTDVAVGSVIGRVIGRTSS